MTDTNKLRSIIKSSGLKQMYIAEKLGITSYGLKLKIDNKTEFKSTEISILCKILNIGTLKEKEEIFFAKEVD